MGHGRDPTPSITPTHLPPLLSGVLTSRIFPHPGTALFPPRMLLFQSITEKHTPFSQVPAQRRPSWPPYLKEQSSLPCPRLIFNRTLSSKHASAPTGHHPVLALLEKAGETWSEHLAFSTRMQLPEGRIGFLAPTPAPRTSWHIENTQAFAERKVFLTWPTKVSGQGLGSHHPMQ